MDGCFIISVEGNISLVEHLDEIIVLHPEDSIVCLYIVDLFLPLISPHFAFVTEWTIVFFFTPWVANLGNGMLHVTRGIFEILDVKETVGMA